jgi:hypothetical protein
MRLCLDGSKIKFIILRSVEVPKRTSRAAASRTGKRGRELGDKELGWDLFMLKD